MTNSKRERGWSAVGENREKAIAAWTRYANGEEVSMTLVELAMARDYAVVQGRGKGVVSEINKVMGAKMRQICGVE